MRQCRLCDEIKDDGHFSYRGGARKGLQADCKECALKRSREYRQNTRDKVSAIKMSIGCECCGFKAQHPCQLDLDHKDPNSKTYKGSHKAYDAGWSWERVEAEIAKCTVLCKNCHALRTYEEGHWENSYTKIRMRQSGSVVA